METDETNRILDSLDSDRAALADRLSAPSWYRWVVAACAAAYVATPVIRPESLGRVVTGIVLAVAVVTMSLHQRCSGVRVGRAGPGGGLLLLGLLVGVLLLLSTSYGLASSLGPWLVLAPATAGLVLVLLGSRWFERLQREYLRRGR